jgi:hypothetical protein
MAKTEKIPDAFRSVYQAEDRLAKSIGKFVLRFQFLEGQVNHSIAVLLRLQTMEIGELVTGPIFNVNTRLDILSSLATGLKMSGGLKRKLKNRVQAVRELNNYRNWLLHDKFGGYVPLDDAWQKMRPRTKDKFFREWKSFAPDEIDERADKCLLMAVDLSKFIKEYVVARDGKNAP